MKRFLLLAAAVALLPISASAQSFLPIEGDEDCMGCPPTMSANDGLTGAASEVGETMKGYSDDLAWGFVWWVATNFSPHIPVDPKCPPPDGCTPDDEDPDDPDGPGGGGEETPPGGGGETPPGGDAPPSDDDEEEPQKSTSSSSSGTVETFDLGDQTAALALRDQIGSVAEGSYVLRGTLEDGSRLRLVSKREATADRGEFVMRFEVIPKGPRSRPVPVLVQAINGKLYARTVTSMPGVRDRVRTNRPRRRSVRG